MLPSIHHLSAKFWGQHTYWSGIIQLSGSHLLTGGVNDLQRQHGIPHDVSVLLMEHEGGHFAFEAGYALP